MSSKGSFENPYDEYTPEIASNVISNQTISSTFGNKLLNFKTDKLEKLFKMEKDLFYDNTVYTGSAGIAYYYVMCAMKSDHPIDELKNAVKYINLDNLKGKRISFLCGDAGPLAIATVVSYKLGSRHPEYLPEYKVLGQRLMGLISLLDTSPDELLYGKAGYLYALLFVNKYINGKVIPANHIEKVIYSILKSGKKFAQQMKSDSPLLWQWHDKIYYGAAHGMAGILYILLQVVAILEL